MDENALIDEVVELLPEIGKLLHAAVASHPLASRLTLAQIKTLVHLHSYGRCTVGEIAAGLGVSMSTASELVDRMVEAGWVERAENPADRRQVLVWLTPESQAFATQVHDLRRAQVRSALNRLAPEERPALLRSLRALAAALRETAGSPSSTSSPTATSTRAAAGHGKEPPS